MEIVNYNDPNLLGGIPDAGGGGALFYNGVPFTGKVQAFYPNGNLEVEEEYVDSHKHGRQVSYYENGQIEEDYYQRFNYFYGISRTYYPNGTLKSQTEYNDEGVDLDTKKYNEQGVLVEHWIKDNKVL